MVAVIEPKNALIRRFVDSVYVFRKSDQSLEFRAYPSVNTPVGLFRNTSMNVEGECVCIANTNKPNHLSMACNQFSGSVQMRYLQMVDEIAINFKPLGFSSFTQSKPAGAKLFYFSDWAAFLPDLFNAVLTTNDPEKQLLCIEAFLLEKYAPLTDETILFQALELLNDLVTEYKIQEIARILGIHYKQLYRSFTENVGCSPIRYRKLLKFRRSVVSKIKSGDSARLVDICYDHGYTDQPYFIKQFKELTGEIPRLFFNEISSFGSDKIIFKIV